MEINYACDGKVKYLTYTEASKKVRAMKRSPHVSDSRQSLNVYRCKNCRSWHIGNSSNLDKQNRNHYKRGDYDKGIDFSIDGD